MTHWTEFGVRHLPAMSARTKVEHIPPPLVPFVDERAAKLGAPFVGVTTDGVGRGGLYPLTSTGVSLEPVTEAAVAFLAALTPEQRDRAVHQIDSDDRRTWINVHMNFFRHGVMLEDLDPAGRQLGLALLRETLSARGYAQARDIMRLNELLAHVSESPDEFGEWPYFITFFGEPGPDQPWGWQIDGHHLVINATVIGDQLVMTPSFMGSEPCHVDSGPMAGTQVFAAEERWGLDMIRCLDDTQQAKAIIRSSIHPDDLPPELQHPFDGRMQAGAFNDNAVLPQDGIMADALSDQQRRVLLNLMATYVGWTRDGHNQIRMDEVAAHLDETSFQWMGGTDNDGPFYYRVHNPVVLIEFDHHPGVAFDNRVPSRNHIHTLVRTPNGGDYGADLLRQHHDRYDHSNGEHHHRHEG
jgi:hypothetical protein